MEVLQLQNHIFISRQPDSYYMIDTSKKVVKAIDETRFDLISNLIALTQDIKALS
ncbi:hypothetical protein [Mucilaginibacter gracilis]|nr:hypothetical protein [Mucilaginibacter gracilis]